MHPAKQQAFVQRWAGVECGVYCALTVLLGCLQPERIGARQWCWFALAAEVVLWINETLRQRSLRERINFLRGPAYGKLPGAQPMQAQLEKHEALCELDNCTLVAPVYRCGEVITPPITPAFPARRLKKYPMKETMPAYLLPDGSIAVPPQKVQYVGVDKTLRRLQLLRHVLTGLMLLWLVLRLLAA